MALANHRAFTDASTPLIPFRFFTSLPSRPIAASGGLVFPLPSNVGIDSLSENSAASHQDHDKRRMNLVGGKEREKQNLVAENSPILSLVIKNMLESFVYEVGCRNDAS